MRYFLTLIILFSTVFCFSQNVDTVKFIIDGKEFNKQQLDSLQRVLYYQSRGIHEPSEELLEKLEKNVLESKNKTYKRVDIVEDNNSGYAEKTLGTILLGSSAALTAMSIMLPFTTSDIEIIKNYDRSYYLGMSIASFVCAIAGTTILCIGIKKQNEYNNRKTKFNLGLLNNGKFGLMVNF